MRQSGSVFAANQHWGSKRKFGAPFFCDTQPFEQLSFSFTESLGLSFSLAFSGSSRQICRFPSHFQGVLSFSLAEFRLQSACLCCISAQIRMTFRCQVFGEEAGVWPVARLVNVEVLGRHVIRNVEFRGRLGWRQRLECQVQFQAKVRMME